MRYLLSTFVDFLDGVTDTHTKQTNSKQFPHYDNTIGSAAVAGHAVTTDRQTDRQTVRARYSSVCGSGPHLAARLYTVIHN